MTTRAKQSSKCKFCKNDFYKFRSSEGKYCSNKCQSNFEYFEYIERWKFGLGKGWSGNTATLSRHIRRWLRETRGSQCERCGWNEVHPTDGLPLTQIDHIDGNCHNCTLENLRILCPNCHSMTPTYGSRNKNSKRIRNK